MHEILATGGTSLLRSNRHLTPGPDKGGRRLLIVCTVVVLCFSQFALAQSGRRPKSTTVPAKATTEQGEATEAPPRMSSLVIGGHDIDPDTKEFWSNQTSIVANACTDELKKRQLGLEIIYSGKMTKVEAVERAKRETAAYVLWFGYRSKLVNLDFLIDYIDYIVLVPKTASTLTEGRVYPAKQKSSADPGGILRLPSRGRGRASNSYLLERGGREIAARVRGIL